MTTKPSTLIQRLDAAMDRLNVAVPIKCTCVTGELREGRPVLCGWANNEPVCKRSASHPSDEPKAA